MGGEAPEGEVSQAVDVAQSDTGQPRETGGGGSRRKGNT